MTLIVLILVLLLAAIWALVLLLHLAVAARSRAAWRKRMAEAAALRPTIEDRLACYLSGSDDLSRLRELAAEDPEQMEQSILALAATVRGEGRDRLCDLLIRLTFVKRWCADTGSRDLMRRRKAYSRLAAIGEHEPARRLAGCVLEQALLDGDEQIRFHGAQALARSNEPEQVNRAFQYAVRGTELTRLLLAQELRVHAIDLCRSAVPAALASSPATEVAAVLQMLASWECVLPLDNLMELANHGDPAVRLETMRILPMVPATAENRAAVYRGLNDTHAGVREAASVAAKQWKMCLTEISPGTAETSEGMLPLEQLCLSGGC